MINESQANEDFRRAIRKALWRKVSSWLRREENELIPYHEVRERLPIKGQSYKGFQTVPLSKIIGSTGRYRDFDRAFLPRQTQTRNRWVSIDKAHLDNIDLPPVQLYQVGDAYFVKDGNHRVSVAREQGREEIDAEVIEVRVGVSFSADTRLSELDRKTEYARFLEITGLQNTYPDVSIEFTLPGEYSRLYEHIDAHRWYLGEVNGSPITYQEAAKSWYENVYLPLVEKIREEGILEDFPGRSESDLFLWISEYQWYRREAFKEDYSAKSAAGFFVHDHDSWPVKKLVRVLRDAAWLDRMLLSTEKEAFEERTSLQKIRPGVDIQPTVPGQYEKLQNHIDVHRWYLGKEKGEEIPYEEAVASWYDTVYLPLIEVIREERILTEFPDRSETDLYLWIVENRSVLLEGEED